MKDLKKECFWDYSLTEEEIKKIIKEGTFIEKKKLFEKIIYNAKDKVKFLAYFDKNDLRKLLNSFTPTYNERYINRHLKALKFIFLNEKEDIKELRWKKI